MSDRYLPLTATDIDEIEGISDLGMPIGGTLVGRLCADWRRLTAERDAALAALPDPMELEGIAGLRAGTSKMLVKLDQDVLFAMADRIRALDTATVPAADVPPFLARRVNGGAA